MIRRVSCSDRADSSLQAKWVGRSREMNDSEGALRGRMQSRAYIDRAS